MSSSRDKNAPIESPGEAHDDLPEVPGAPEPERPGPAEPERPGPAEPERPGPAEPEPEPLASLEAEEEGPVVPELLGLVDEEGKEPWLALEPLPPLDQILPEHIAYIRAAVSRYSVTPAHWREDLVQEILIQAHRSRDSRLDVRALLSGITRHMVFRWMARRDAERTAVALHPGRGPLTNRSVEDDWEEAERREAIRAAIDELPDIFREVFLRTEIEHMTMPEVASDLGIPVNTGYTRLHLARARFLESLQRFLARRRIQKQDLSVPVVVGAASSLGDGPGEADAPAGTEPPQTDAGTAPEPHLDTAPTAEPGATATTAGKVAAATKAGGFVGAAPWIGGGLVAATAVAVGVWIARSPEASPPDTTATAEPRSGSSSGTSSDETTSLPDDTGTDPRPPSTAPRASTPPLPSDADEPASPTSDDAAAPDASPRVAPGEGLAARHIIGLAKAGRRDEAILALEAFQKKYPNSLYWTQISEALAAPPSPPDR